MYEFLAHLRDVSWERAQQESCRKLLHLATVKFWEFLSQSFFLSICYIGSLSAEKCKWTDTEKPKDKHFLESELAKVLTSKFVPKYLRNVLV